MSTISRIPTLTCSHCQTALPIGELANHQCDLPSKPSTPLTLDTSFPSLHKHDFNTSPLDQVPELLASARLRRTPSTESNETWKIARPTKSPLSALSRSFSIESKDSPATPQAYLAFRLPDTTVSFFKTQRSNLKPHVLQWPKDNRPRCFRCKRSIRANPIAVGTTQYHPACLTCYVCRDPLQTVREHQGHVYCADDYQQFIQSRQTCATCETTIDPPTRPTQAFGQYYHPDHLTCTHCDKPVDEATTGIVRHKKKIYCRPDFNALYLPACRGCGRAVETQAVSSADGKLTGQWHKRCFKCHACAEPFKHRFYVLANQPYCQYDYHRLNGSLCAGCDRPIEGRCAQTTTSKYHPPCFTCHTCAQPIQDVYYSDPQHIYCPDHGHRKNKRTTLYCDL